MADATYRSTKDDPAKIGHFQNITKVQWGKWVVGAGLQISAARFGVELPDVTMSVVFMGFTVASVNVPGGPTGWVGSISWGLPDEHKKSLPKWFKEHGFPDGVPDSGTLELHAQGWPALSPTKAAAYIATLGHGKKSDTKDSGGFFAISGTSYSKSFTLDFKHVTIS